MATVTRAAPVSRTSEVPTIMKRGKPWAYLIPALVVMFTFIVYPGINTIYLSFRNTTDTGWATEMCTAGQPCWGIFENYRYAITSEVMQTAFLNNVKWIILMVSTTVALGLLIASLANQVRYEAVAKAIIFVPMAISFVGAGVIWKFVYDYGTGPNQIGLLNGILTAFGGKPVAWLTAPQVNTLALILVGVWMWTGFCMTILGAAIKGVPTELLEAARTDGATEFEAFRKITIPYILPTITVVITVMIINTLKIFDIVYVMTGGNYGTEVIANRMYVEMFYNQQTGRASAIAVILILILVPAMIMNVRRFMEQEQSR